MDASSVYPKIKEKEEKKKKNSGETGAQTFLLALNADGESSPKAAKKASVKNISYSDASGQSGGSEQQGH